MSLDDKYTYPGSGGVLRNKLNITDRDALDDAMNDYATPRWETNPIGVVAREAVRAGIGSREPSSRPEAARFTRELRAIAALIEAHRTEFDEYVAALDSTISIADRRSIR